MASPEQANDDALALHQLQDFLQNFEDTKDGNDGWTSTLKDELKLISASSSPTGKTTFTFKVGPQHVNKLNNLHGGCTATLFDWCTTTAIIPMSKPYFWRFLGVSRTLNVTYLRPIALGEEILIQSEVIHAGKRLALCKGVMRRASDGAVMATCEHGKVNIDPDLDSKL